MGTAWRVAAGGAAALLAAACTAPEDGGAPPVTPNEQRALAEARAMIPASERPPATPAATEGAKP